MAGIKLFLGGIAILIFSIYMQVIPRIVENLSIGYWISGILAALCFLGAVLSKDKTQ